MNAITHHTPAATRAVPHPTHKLKWLLKREFWEHRGGFFWAPLIAGLITLLFTVLAAVGGSIAKARFGNEIVIDNGNHDETARALGAAGDVAVMGGIVIATIVLGFVVFFYALGNLYDDRRDRSVLFWKSMPVSDAATVAAKAIWALLLAPLIAVAVGVVIGLALWVVAALTTTINGVPGTSGIFTYSQPFRVVGNTLAMLPLYALWALPAVGWLMLCSAAARSKPFLWAVMLPVLGCALVSFANLVMGMNMDIGRLWYVVAFRGLLSVFPASMVPVLGEHAVSTVNEPADIAGVADAAHGWALAARADLWIGAVAGLLMLLAAVRLRRWRDDT